MNPSNQKLAANIINKSYLDLGENSLNSHENYVKILLSQRIMPEIGWDDLTIEYFINSLAIMDTNNFPNKVGVGERESRIYCNIVKKRNFYMGHGIGRSGDIDAIQPKAAGSSLIAKITKYLVKDALKLSGYQFIEDLLIMPQATGMTITLTLLTLKSIKPQAKYVIWPRIDQKSCLKCIYAANLTALSIDGKIVGDEIQTNVNVIQDTIEKYGVENILCILSTTSCFAPRVPDNIEKIAEIAKNYNIFHVINNAYGIQCTKIANSINLASKFGKVDAIISSTDKNFMVPVGGAIIFSPLKKEKGKISLIKSISELYPGRASVAPILDLFITLLSMGKKGLLNLLNDRKENLKYMKDQIKLFAQKHNEKMLETPNNSISMALTLINFRDYCENQDQQNAIMTSELGSILYSKRVMGSRILIQKQCQKICGIPFNNYGTNHDSYPKLPYMTMACAIGMHKEEIDLFLIKLQESFDEINKKIQKQIILKQLEAKEDNNKQNIEKKN